MDSLALCVLLGLAIGTGAAAAAPGMVSLRSSLDMAETAELDRWWSRSVGSGRLINGVRADWQRHLHVARQKLGVEYVRAHGTLNSEFQISPAPGVYSFINLGKRWHSDRCWRHEPPVVNSRPRV